MPRPDITKLIADNLHALPHEDGRPRRLMHFSQFALGEDNKQRVQSLAVDIAECLQFLLEDNGFVLSHRADPKPADVEDYKTAHLKCGCGATLIGLNVSADMIATLGPTARRMVVAKLQSECPRHE